MGLLSKWSEREIEEREEELRAQDLHRQAREALVYQAKAYGFTQDSPFVDGPMTCATCYALVVPERAREHAEWHSKS